MKKQGIDRHIKPDVRASTAADKQMCASPKNTPIPIQISTSTRLTLLASIFCSNLNTPCQQQQQQGNLDDHQPQMDGQPLPLLRLQDHRNHVKCAMFYFTS